MSHPEAGPLLRRALSREAEGVTVINAGLAVDDLTARLRDEMKLTMGASAGIVVCILFFFMRRLSHVLHVLIPMSMGLVFTAGVMGWLGIHLNPFNFIVLPILIGIGLDDGIHITRRFLESGRVDRVVATTGRSVLMTSLTTVCGFGSLAMADYHVLESMGLMAIVGVGACFLFSVITLPALLRLGEGV
jgi:predicted RND superfamily exporter protein